jgi:beta-glucosidase
MHAGRSILAPYLWMLSLALPASERPAYLDPAQPVAKRVSDVLKRMTLEDKIAQMNLWWSGKDEGAERGSAEGALRAVVESLPGLTGSIRTPGILFGFAQRMKPDVAFQVELRNQVQELAVRSSRLKIPVLWVEEGAHGVGVPGATMFPQPIALGSTWDVDLVEQIGRAMGEEANALGIHQLCMSPVLDVYRDVRMGRTEQGYGEDPYLVARMGVARHRARSGGDFRENLSGNLPSPVRSGGERGRRALRDGRV